MVARDFCCFVVSRRAAARQKDDVFYQKAYESTRVTYEPAAVGTGGSRFFSLEIASSGQREPFSLISASSNHRLLGISPSSSAPALSMCRFATHMVEQKDYY
jgi:hypothetical protein